MLQLNENNTKEHNSRLILANLAEWRRRVSHLGTDIFLDGFVTFLNNSDGALATYISNVRHAAALAHEIPDEDILDFMPGIILGYSDGVTANDMADELYSSYGAN